MPRWGFFCSMSYVVRCMSYHVNTYFDFFWFLSNFPEIRFDKQG